MQRYLSYLFVSLMIVAISGGFCSPAISQEVLSLNQEDAEPTASNAEMTTRLLIVGKGKVADPEELQKREKLKRSKGLRSRQAEFILTP